jgi:TolA-binding protein
MEELVLRCLRKSPQERFRDAFHFLAELAATRGRLRDAAPGSVGSVDGGADHRRAETAPEGIVVGTPDAAADATIDSSLGATSPGGPGASGRATPPGAPRLTALDYNRHTIPVPPALDGLDTPLPAARGGGWVTASPPGGISLATAPARTSDGLLGVRRWRLRFDAIRAALDDVEAQQPAPPEVAHAMAQAATSLELLEEGARLAEARQQAVEELADQAREFRARRGAHVDDLGRRLSERRGELERLGARREALRGSLAAARDPAAGVVTGAGATDALLWEVAAVDEVLRAEGARCDELEKKLAQLRGELEQHDERVERELASHVHTLDAELVRLDPLAAGLRAPLDRVEAFLAAQFARSSGDA